MADLFVGKWNMESSDNFDKYMKTVGVNAFMASLGSHAKPTLYVSVEGDTWTLKSETTFKTATIHFQLGVEFDETTADDRKMKTTITLVDGNKLIQDQKPTNDKDCPSVINRTVEGDTMTVLCQAKDVTSTRIYKKCT
jgi:hypothetical protein